MGPRPSDTTFAWNPEGKIKPSGSPAKANPAARTNNNFFMDFILLFLPRNCVPAPQDQKSQEVLLGSTTGLSLGVYRCSRLRTNLMRKYAICGARLDSTGLQTGSHRERLHPQRYRKGGSPGTRRSDRQRSMTIL